jgi:hypothetical protein
LEKYSEEEKGIKIEKYDKIINFIRRRDLDYDFIKIYE